jgi:methionyl-tRNA formyltransferase
MSTAAPNMSQRLRIAFAGSPEFAAVSLRALLADGQHDIVAVYTQPDRPSGRGRTLNTSPVKQLALSHGVDVRQPVSLRDERVLEDLQALHLDLFIVVAYGLLLPEPVLTTPRLGCVNVHASLLPRWRGAAPIERAILAGDTRTGVTLMQIETALDSGPMLRQATCDIRDDDTAGTLHDRLARLGAETLVASLPALARGELTPQRQDDRLATYAAKIDRREAELDWKRPAIELARRVRAFNPRFGASTALAGEPVKVWEAVVVPARGSRSPGEILYAGNGGIDVATADDALRLLRVQAPGRRIVSAAEFLNARPHLKAGR